ncbi:MAG: hypothetical protein LAQ69_40705 [Acidobacteriia bacterium]|nr:hypothetical protein [Terriglobia bacterium]
MPIPEGVPGVRKLGPMPTGSALLVTGTKNALATLTTTIVVTDPAPSTWGSAVALVPGVPTPEYQPQRLDFGELMAREARHARVTIISPNDTTLGAAWTDQSHAPEVLTPRFTIDQITSYTHGWKSVGNILGHVREVDQTTVNQPIQVREGQEVTIDVTFEAGLDENDRYFNTLQIAGLPWRLSIPAQANVTLLGDTGAVLVDVRGGFQALKGQQVSLNATVTRIGRAATVTISGDYLPQGVTMSDVTTTLGDGEQRDIILQFNVAQDAPAIREFQASLGVALQNRSRQVGIGISVYDPILYSTVKIDAGSLRGDMEVTLKADGSWTWHVSLSEHSALIGKNYIVEFGLAMPAEVGQLGLYRIEPGTIAATLIPGDSNKTIDQAGSHASIRDHFFEIVDAGVYFEADVSDNVLPLIAAIGTMFAAGVGVVAAFQDLFADSKAPPTPAP